MLSPPVRRCPDCGKETPLARKRCPYCRALLPVGEETRSLEDIYLQEKLSGRFEIISQISRRGMALVFLARDLILERQVIIKSLCFGEGVDAAILKKWKDNARRAVRLDNVNVLRNYTFGEAGPLYYFITEYFSEPMLSTYFDQRRKVPLWESLRIARDIARALHAAHNMGIAHHRLKPSNVTVPVDGFSMVLDFGSAQGTIDAISGQPWSADKDSVLYFAPEQIETGVSDARSDQYSLGLILYYLLSGKHPFPGHGEESALERLHKTPVPLRKLNPEIPLNLELIVNQCLATDPQVRYESCEELAQALESLDPKLWTYKMTPDPAQDTAYRVREYLEKARIARKNRRFRSAVFICEQALVLDPYNPEVTDLLVELKKLNERANEVRGLINTALSAFYEHRLDSALTVLHRVRRIDKSNPEVIRLTHEVLREQERIRLSNVLIQAARIDLDQQALTQAMSKIVKIQEIDPGNPVILKLKHEIEAAMEDKASIGLLLSKAEKHLENMRFESALEIIAEVFRIDPMNQAAEKLQLRIKEARKQEQLAILKKQLETALQLKHFDRASGILQKVKDIDPGLAKELDDKMNRIKSTVSKIQNSQTRIFPSPSRAQLEERVNKTDKGTPESRPRIPGSISRKSGMQLPKEKSRPEGRQNAPKRAESHSAGVEKAGEMRFSASQPGVSAESESRCDILPGTAKAGDAPVSSIPVESGLLPVKSGTFPLKSSLLAAGVLIVLVAVLLVMHHSGNDSTQNSMLEIVPTNPAGSILPTEIPTRAIAPTPTMTPMIVPIPTPTFTTPELQVRELLARGAAFEDKGNYRRAAETYKQALMIQRTNIEAQGGLARSLRHSKRAKRKSNGKRTRNSRRTVGHEKRRPATPTPISRARKQQFRKKKNTPRQFTPTPSRTFSVQSVEFDPNPIIPRKKFHVTIRFSADIMPRVQGVWFNYRYQGERGFLQEYAVKTGGCFRLTIPGRNVHCGELLYFISAITTSGIEIKSGSAENPKLQRIEK